MTLAVVNGGGGGYSPTPSLTVDSWELPYDYGVDTPSFEPTYRGPGDRTPTYPKPEPPPPTYTWELPYDYGVDVPSFEPAYSVHPTTYVPTPQPTVRPWELPPDYGVDHLGFEPTYPMPIMHDTRVPLGGGQIRLLEETYGPYGYGGVVFQCRERDPGLYLVKTRDGEEHHIEAMTREEAMAQVENAYAGLRVVGEERERYYAGLAPHPLEAPDLGLPGLWELPPGYGLGVPGFEPTYMKPVVEGVPPVGEFPGSPYEYRARDPEAARWSRWLPLPPEIDPEASAWKQLRAGVGYAFKTPFHALERLVAGERRDDLEAYRAGYLYTTGMGEVKETLAQAREEGLQAALEEQVPLAVEQYEASWKEGIEEASTKWDAEASGVLSQVESEIEQGISSALREYDRGPGEGMEWTLSRGEYEGMLRDYYTGYRRDVEANLQAQRAAWLEDLERERSEDVTAFAGEVPELIREDFLSQWRAAEPHILEQARKDVWAGALLDPEVGWGVTIPEVTMESAAEMLMRVRGVDYEEALEAVRLDPEAYGLREAVEVRGRSPVERLFWTRQIGQVPGFQILPVAELQRTWPALTPGQRALGVGTEAVRIAAMVVPIVRPAAKFLRYAYQPTMRHVHLPQWTMPKGWPGLRLRLPSVARTPQYRFDIAMHRGIGEGAPWGRILSAPHEVTYMGYPKFWAETLGGARFADPGMATPAMAVPRDISGVPTWLRRAFPEHVGPRVAGWEAHGVTRPGFLGARTPLDPYYITRRFPWLSADGVRPVPIVGGEHIAAGGMPVQLMPGQVAIHPGVGVPGYRPLPIVRTPPVVPFVPSIPGMAPITAVASTMVGVQAPVVEPRVATPFVYPGEFPTPMVSPVERPGYVPAPGMSPMITPSPLSYPSPIAYQEERPAYVPVGIPHPYPSPAPYPMPYPMPTPTPIPMPIYSPPIHTPPYQPPRPPIIPFFFPGGRVPGAGMVWGGRPGMPMGIGKWGFKGYGVHAPHPLVGRMVGYDWMRGREIPYGVGPGDRHRRRSRYPWEEEEGLVRVAAY